jgi:GT2 family glycosyltransferase
VTEGPPRGKVFVVSVDERLRPLAVGPGYLRVLLVVRKGATVLGHVSLPALEVLPVDVQRAAIAEQLGERLWRLEAETVLRRALGLVAPAATPARSVSVIVCTRDRPDDLERCLSAIGQLSTPPLEVLVVDNAPSDDQGRRVCERFPVRYVVEPLPGQSRARNRGILETNGELVAFTDDDCVVDPGWLDGLGAELEDVLVQAVTGYVGPLELDAPAQYLFEAHGGFGRGFQRRVFHGVLSNPALSAGQVGAGANSIFRRTAFERVGLFAEDLGPGTPARAADDNDMFARILDAGYRIVFDPARVVWHRHRRDDEALRSILSDYGVSSSAFVARRVGRHRDLSALRILAWWWLEHFPRDMAAILGERPARLSPAALGEEMLGTLLGPWKLRRSRQSRRSIPELELPAAVGLTASLSPAVEREWPSISVVIPTHDRRDRLRDVLAGLAAQTFPHDRLDAVVVADGCSDGSAAMARALELPFAVSVVEADHAGIAVARNLGVENVNAPVVLFLDDDTVPEPGCLAPHAAAHAGSVDHVVLGYCPPVLRESWLGMFLRQWWEDHYRRKREPGHRFTFFDFVTGNASLPRSLLLDAGGFDPAFTSRHEDWELGIRLLERGVAMEFRPDAVAPHHLDASIEKAVLDQRREGAGDVLLARRHPIVTRQLPFAGYEPGLPSADERTLARRVRSATRNESLRLQRRWRRSVIGALRDGYVLGVLAEAGAAADVAALVAAAPPPVTVPVDLDGPGRIGPLVLPPLGQLELELRDRGRPVATVAPMPPGRQWDWAQAVERIGHVAGGELRAALLQRELDAERDAVGAGEEHLRRVP